ncbi:LutC/YkgG family protein [Streptomyces physcomitrii]|uniref:Lactate utilization protein C n=1 Tax=Streptomyces physcomitrii TaxID=2724184 RepID=A0ABX1H7M0_9ACTN|nr:lactate utilization protein C [Streptomyces physcomitrii]NKI44058.1 lactate utilization protein C [Streptomyces physcomitrii]
MSSRTEILRRVRSALADVPRTEQPGDVAVPRAYRDSHVRGEEAAVFAERVAYYRARVVTCAPAGAPAAVARLLGERGARRVVLPGGFPADFLPPGEWSWLRDQPPLGVEELDAADAVLTTAALGVAATGTLVLDAGPGQGRRVLTLLPDHHICVLRAEQIVGDVPEALRLLDPYRPLTFVSGPSATSDIELNRVEGVHGPRRLDVVLVGEVGEIAEKGASR